MSEVVEFEQPRRRGPRPGGGNNRGQARFFSRRELDALLQIYSRKVMAGEWLDYALTWDARGVSFAVYNRWSDVALYEVRKRPASGRREVRYEVSSRGRVLKTGPDLADVVAVLECCRPRLVS